MKRGLVLGLAGLVALGLVGALAEAKGQHLWARTKVVIDDYTYDEPTDTFTFTGRISSDLPRCVGRRTVRLTQTTDAIPAGTDRTNGSGKWTISFKGADVALEGDFHARADERVYNKRRSGKLVTKTVCKGGTSGTVTIGSG